MNEASSVIASDCAAAPGQRCNFVSIGEFPDISGSVGKVEVLRCTSCGHGVTVPQLSDVAFLYADRESQDYQPDAHGLSAVIKDVAFRIQARKLLRQVSRAPRSVLDFGCGSGQFTRVLGEMLCGARVVGSDFHAAPPAGLRGRPYRPMANLAGEAKTFDLVTALHVLEHDDNTGQLLTKIVSMARPGGTVVIEVPHVDCVWTKLFGKKWDAWYTPFHRTHFTRLSLRHQLQNQGLDVLAMHDVTVPTMGRTLANCFGSKNNLFWLLLGIAFHPLQWLGEKLSGQPSAIRVIIQV